MIDDGPHDIVEFMLNLMRAEGLDADSAHQIEHVTRQQFGGLRVHIPKKKKHLTPEQRQQAYQDGLTNMPTDEIMSKYKIGRSALYVLMKRGA